MSISDQELLDTMHEIGRLLFLRLTGELTIEEQIALDNWLSQQDPYSRQFFEDCSDWEEVREALAMMYQLDEAAALADVQKKIQLLTEPTVPVVHLTTSPRRRGFIWAGAAGVLAVVGISLFYTLDRKKTPVARQSFEQRVRNDVVPGGDKAILELADGSKIVLDNAANGELAKQGATKVIKLDNGQLAYNAGKNGTVAEISYNTITTPKGGQYQVVLPDGSKIWLNAMSRLRFPTVFTGSERRIEVIGEAFFEVAKNHSAPFKVIVNNNASPMEVAVLGTEFNLMAYDNENGERATLVNGSVRVTAGGKQKALQPNQQAFLDKRSSTLSLIDSVNTDEITAWKSGYFRFNDASIETIMRQAARWYDIDVVYEGRIEQHLNGGIPRSVSLATLLKILEATGWVHFQVDGKKVTVSP